MKRLDKINKSTPQSRRESCFPARPNSLISVVIPVWNEAELLPRCIKRFRELAETEGPIEIVVADGGSDDGTYELAKTLADIVIRVKKGRALQLNYGASIAGGGILFFPHATVLAPEGAFDAIRGVVSAGYSGGGFSNAFERNNTLIKSLGKILGVIPVNRDRPENVTFYGDNGIFVTRAAFDKLGGFRIQPIMEDFEFSRRMARDFLSQRIVEPKLILSPRRHERAGFIKTRLLWILIYSLYRVGAPAETLAKFYADVR